MPVLPHRPTESAATPVKDGDPETPTDSPRSGADAKLDISDQDREILNSVFGTSIVGSVLSVQWKDRKEALEKSVNTIKSKVRLSQYPT